MRLLAVISLMAFAATAADALAPPPPCYWDGAAGRFVPLGQETAAMDPAFLSEAGDGFAVLEVFHSDTGKPDRYVLQHCRSGSELLVVLPRGDQQPARSRFEDMAFGAGRYTMRQIGDEMALQGAGVRMSRNEFGDCACDLMAGWAE